MERRPCVLQQTPRSYWQRQSLATPPSPLQSCLPAWQPVTPVAQLWQQRARAKALRPLPCPPFGDAPLARAQGRRVPGGWLLGRADRP
eukprot:353725-Chlamydomonas_euryale.AAC.2